ncbi:MAG: hydrolase, partial [Patescibacteria group bacterium]
TRSFFYMPLNMSSVMTKIQKTAEDAGATMPPKEAMILSRELSPWKAEQLYAVSKPIDGADNVTLSGTFLTKVFDGPFKDAGKWYTALTEFAKTKDKKAEKVYMFYTTCPKCAKHYGHNYVIGLAQVA